ncbi:MAG: LamG domain protein jellyroll fold domain protein, partial [Bacteroidetes bacterium]|nr:LamG domain protein jellyroll fold domain protein [Bacteroidota bacterium]
MYLAQPVIARSDKLPQPKRFCLRSLGSAVLRTKSPDRSRHDIGPARQESLKHFHVTPWLPLIALAMVIGRSSAQQLSVPRVDAMPDRPAPYVMRDWKQVARGYDSLVYDIGHTGQYLPLVFWNNSPKNYPTQRSYGLHTVVGTTVPDNSEAINVLPSLIGATLAGIDKKDQNGNDWVLMSQNFFNIKSEELVYLNNEVTNSGDDWWYDTMPNVFFYQLCWLYPGHGDSERQFSSVADRWLQAVRSMGGVTTPWHIPNMDHRGWRLLSMTPNDEQPHEPESAGAIAWLLYNAWLRTGDIKYRSGAELSLEFLNAYPSNPSYELQLSYGAYIAARMNAELGTTYDVPKIVNWCFDRGPIRSWGAVIGKWGGLDCSGLIGEINGSNDYAFLMNTLEQVGALVPLVRYDDRFACAIGKWVLNAANAARLFYPNFLPDQNQDSEDWSHIYDPDGYIGHEALRQRQT